MTIPNLLIPLCYKKTREMIKTAKILPTKVLIKEIKEERKETKSGIVLVEQKRNPTTKGTVVMVGDGTPSLPMVAKVGMTVLFNSMSPVRFDLDEDEYLLLDHAHILFLYQ